MSRNSLLRMESVVSLIVMEILYKVIVHFEVFKGRNLINLIAISGPVINLRVILNNPLQFLRHSASLLSLPRCITVRIGSSARCHTPIRTLFCSTHILSQLSHITYLNLLTGFLGFRIKEWTLCLRSDTEHVPSGRALINWKVPQCRAG